MPLSDTTPSCPNLSTEEKITEAAIRVFTRKGYEGTRTRDIAEEAGINVATLHYYHRTKEKLFSFITHKVMDEFTEILLRVFAKDVPLKDRIYDFVEEYTELFRRKPYVATFCLVESERNPEAFREVVDFRQCQEILTEQLDRMARAGEIRPVSATSFITALVGMTIYPFITRGTVLTAGQFDEADWHTLLEENKNMIPGMMVGYLWGTSPLT